MLFEREVKLLKGKTVALLVLLVIMVGAFFVTSEYSTTVVPGKQESSFSFLESLCKTIVVLGDPVPGGSGGGGDNSVGRG